MVKRVRLQFALLAINFVGGFMREIKKDGFYYFGVAVGLLWAALFPRAHWWYWLAWLVAGRLITGAVMGLVAYYKWLRWVHKWQGAGYKIKVKKARFHFRRGEAHTVVHMGDSEGDLHLKEDFK